MIDFKKPPQGSHLAPQVSLVKELGTRTVFGALTFGGAAFLGAPTALSALAGVAIFVATNPNN